MILEDLDLALYNKLTGITVIDELGATVTVPVVIKAPEEEFKTEVIPSIVLSLIDVRYDPIRQNWGNEETIGVDTASIKQAPIPYEIMYQVGIFTRYAEDDRKVCQNVTQKLPPRTHIVTGTGSTERDWYVFLTSYAESDIIGERRIFRKFYTYMIPAELEFDEAASVKLVRQRLLNLKTI